MAHKKDKTSRVADGCARLLELVAQLRGPRGCRWDRAQTLDTLKPNLLEETYEVLEAMSSPREHGEELGDLLLQVVMHAQLRDEQGEFSLADVIEGIAAKLVRRHPHVFGNAPDAAEGSPEQWERVKSAERPARQSRLDGIPKALPALLRAWRTGQKAATLGFDWNNEAAVRAKAHEEMQELGAALADAPSAQQRQAVAAELGDVLFTLANWARHLGVDPEAALHAATDKFHRRFRYLESNLDGAISENATEPSHAVDALERLWEDAKKKEAD